MNIFLSADIEGTCGIAAWSETEAGKPDGDFAYFKTQMSEEVAAACRGAVSAGAARILVKDAHATARNINPIVLPQEVQINRGWSGDAYSMMSGIQRGEWDAVVLTGYHAAACSPGNPLSHTMNPRIDFIDINGVRASEFTIAAYTAGYHGVPVCFLSGDSAVCEAARRMIPAIAVVPVNKGEGNSATSLHPDLAVQRIEHTLHEQLESERYLDCMVDLPREFDIRIRYREHRDAYHNSAYPGVEQLDEKMLHFVCNDYMDALRLFHFVL